MIKVTITNVKDPSRQWVAPRATQELMDAYLVKSHLNREGRRLQREIIASSETFDEADVVSERTSAEGARYVTLCAEAVYEFEDVSRDVKLQAIRKKRDRLISRADLMVNKAEDLGSLVVETRAYRQALRDVTEPFKSDPASLDSVDPASFQFPAAP